MITFSRIELRTPAGFTLTLLALSILAGCSGGSRKSEHSTSATSARTSAFAVGNVLEDDISTGIVKLPSTSPTPSMPFTPTAPVPRPPVAADVDVTDVKIGVNDLGFDRDGIWNHPAAYASQLRGVIAAGEAERGAHGSAVTRLMAGRDIGDGFPVGAANSAELYIAHVPRFHTPARMQYNLEQFAANGVKIINNSWSIDDYNSLPLPANTAALAANPNVQDTLAVFDRAVNRDNQLLVWSVGNDSQPSPYFIAAAPLVNPDLEKGWLTVTTIKNGVRPASVNACGAAANWCLAAEPPGNFIGSSFAAPLVTATAAQVSQVFPWMSNHELRQTILSTTDYVGPASEFGWGKLNSDRAVRGPGLFDTRLTLGEPTFVADTQGHHSNFYNDIGGDAGLDKRGAGTLTLWGNNSYTGESTVHEGSLAVYGTQQSGVNVEEQGTLISNGGRIKGSVTNAGLVQVEGVGLTIEGFYVADDQTARFATQLGTTTTIGQTAVLNGSTLAVLKPDDRYIVKAVETVLVADSVDGTFGRVEVEPTLMYRMTPIYGSNRVDLEVNRQNVVVLADDLYPGHPTRSAAAEAVETAFVAADKRVQGADNTSVTQDFIDTAAKLQGETSPTALAASLDSFSGQIHASSQALTFQQSEAVNRTLSDRVDMLSHAQNTTGMWAGLLGGSGKIEKHGYARGNTHHAGGQIGLDHRVAPNSILGVALSFSQADSRFTQYGGKADSQSAGLSLYGRQGAETGTYVAGRLGQSRISTDVERDVVVRGQTSRIKSDRTDRMTSAYAELGHTLSFDSARATPFVGVSYDALRRGAIDESGNAFALKGDKKSYDQVAATLGLRLQSQPLSWAGVESTLAGYGAYRYGNATNLNYSAAFAGAPDVQSEFKGIGLQRHTGWVGVGVSTTATARLDWNVNYDVQVGRGGINNSLISGGLRYTFG